MKVVDFPQGGFAFVIKGKILRKLFRDEPFVDTVNRLVPCFYSFRPMNEV